VKFLTVELLAKILFLSRFFARSYLKRILCVPNGTKKNVLIIFARVSVIFMFFFLISCISNPQPVIINELPTNSITQEMSMDEYVKESTRYAVELKAYTDELINQIIHRSRYIDLRKNK